MNAILLAALMIGTSYRAEDFNYYDENLKARGLPVANKIYVESPKDKKQFLVDIENLKGLDRFKEFRNPDLDGFLLFFNNKKETIDAVNKLASKYRAYPVVIFNGIECSVTNEIMVHVHPSVSQEDFLKRLAKVADGKFSSRELKPKLFLIKVEDLKNPLNVMVLANLIAKDSFWTTAAMVAWTPIDGYVKANVSVESPANGQLGEMRNFKVTVNVFDPDIKVRTDLLPQLGQSLLPFPFAGEVWFDPAPPVVNETKVNRGKIVTINYAFRQLQYGNFAFQPIVVSYEKNGELKTIKTNTSQYSIRSVIAGTEIDDLQPRTNDGLNLAILRPVGFPKTENPMKSVYWYAKVGISSICFSIAAILLGGALATGKRNLAAWYRGGNKDEGLWEGLEYSRATPDRRYYWIVSKYLNSVMNGVYGVSLYSVNLSECTSNFKRLVEELDRLYQPNATYNAESLKDLVKTFCKDRKYK